MTVLLKLKIPIGSGSYKYSFNVQMMQSESGIHDVKVLTLTEEMPLWVLLTWSQFTIIGIITELRRRDNRQQWRSEEENLRTESVYIAASECEL
jgi:hypothetical protein